MDKHLCPKGPYPAGARPPPWTGWGPSKAASGETLGTTSIDLAELYCGAERSSQREAALGSILILLDAIAQVPFGHGAARRFGTLMTTMHQAGRPIPAVDGLIAAVVLENGGRIVTRNDRHFANIHGLERIPC